MDERSIQIRHHAGYAAFWAPKTVYDLVFSKYLLEPIHFTMERSMMLGIRERAERRN